MVQLLEMQSNLDVAHGANIKGKATWKNVSLSAGAAVVAVFFLGKGGSLYQFTYEGVEYLIGSLVAAVAPSIGASVTTEIPSKAMFADIWDAQVMIGYTTGTIRTVQFDGRIAGLNKADINAGYLTFYDSKWYTGVLNVAAPAKLAEVTGFVFAAG